MLASTEQALKIIDALISLVENQEYNNIITKPQINLGPSCLYNMKKTVIKNNQMIMSKQDFTESIKSGFFQIKIPDNLKKSIRVIDQFAREFYKDKS